MAAIYREMPYFSECTLCKKEAIYKLNVRYQGNLTTSIYLCQEHKPSLVELINIKENTLEIKVLGDENE